LLITQFVLVKLCEPLSIVVLTPLSWTMGGNSTGDIVADEVYPKCDYC